jgi:hypothetical protein
MKRAKNAVKVLAVQRQTADGAAGDDIGGALVITQECALPKVAAACVGAQHGRWSPVLTVLGNVDNAILRADGTDGRIRWGGAGRGRTWGRNSNVSQRAHLHDEKPVSHRALPDNVLPFDVGREFENIN